MGRHRRASLVCRLLLGLSIILGLFSPALPAAARPATEPPSQIARSTPTPTLAVDPVIGDLIALRTQNSRTYPTAQGFQTVVSPSTLNYQDPTGAWQAIDDILIPTRTGFQNKADRYTASLPQNLANGPVTVTSGNNSVSFALVGAQGTATTSGNTATYANALAGVTLTYRAQPNTLQETLTLTGPTAPASYTFTLHLSSGLTARVNPAGGIDFLDAKGQIVLGLGTPAMIDNSHTAAGVSHAVHLSLGPNNQTVILSADPRWLADPARVWPVQIDPRSPSTPPPTATSPAPRRLAASALLPP